MTDQSLALSGHKAKALIAGLIIAGITLTGATPAGDAPTFTAEEFSSLPDEQRWYLVDEGYTLPVPPPGYVWAEDLTLVPESFYEGASPAPSSSLLQQRIETVIDALDACGQDELAMQINDAYSWTSGDPQGASSLALELMAEGAERVAERVGC